MDNSCCCSLFRDKQETRPSTVYCRSFKKLKDWEYASKLYCRPGISLEVEKTPKHCKPCQYWWHATVCLYSYLRRCLNVLVHINYAGSIIFHMHLLMVETYSKLMEIQISMTATFMSTIEYFWLLFATHRLPELIVLNNGLEFITSEFTSFLE